MKVQLLYLLLAATLAPLCYGWLLKEASSTPLAASGDSCNCDGTIYGEKDPELYICGDERLGPINWPNKLPLRSFVTDYNRFGGLTPGEFLEKWIQREGRYEGKYLYPGDFGFSLDITGTPMNRTMVLEVGSLVDRFGDESGKYLSAADAPFSQRSLPPSSLNTNSANPGYPHQYHIYRVIKSLILTGGPIAPWFGQPGLGTQFHTAAIGDITTLKAKGYLEEVDPSVLISNSRGCA
ncbi:unnamed protein product [Calypogeia fissa]